MAVEIALDNPRITRLKSSDKKCTQKGVGIRNISLLTGLSEGQWRLPNFPFQE